MELYLVLILLSVGSCSEYDSIVPVSYGSALAKYESDSLKNRAYEKSDFSKIDEDYEKYINQKRKKYENNNKYNGVSFENYSHEELDKIFGYTGPTANDEPENLIRPCALDDWECIRKYFASNGKCKPAYGPIPDPLYQDIYTIFFPSANLTAALPGLQIRGLSSARVTELYFNKKSGNLVFAFQLESWNVLVPRAYLRYRRTAKESIILAGLGTITFRSSIFTAVIPKVPDLRLDLADSHVDIQDPVTPFFLSPEIAASPDPDVVTGAAALTGRLPLSIQEGAFFEVQLLTALYIQTNICDFGLKLISV